MYRAVFKKRGYSMGMFETWGLLGFIVALIGAILLQLYIASVSRNIAREKGFEEGKWFHISFWFPFVGYILVAGLPDLKARRAQEETNRLLQRIADAKGIDSEVKSFGTLAALLPKQ